MNKEPLIFKTDGKESILSSGQYPLFESVPESALNSQVGGEHYKKLGEFQPWNVLAKWLTPEELFGYMKGTVIAYLARNKDNPRQDAEKAMHTIQLYLELSEKK